MQATFRAHGIRRGPHASTGGRSKRLGLADATELKIAAFVEEGLSNPEIAARLLLSRRTVATHVSHILKKLNVATADRHRPGVRPAHHPATVMQPEPPRR